MSNTVVRSNFPIFGIMGLIFITLKLTGHITWSWWWVLGPFWMPITIVFILAIILGIGIVIKEKINNE